MDQETKVITPGEIILAINPKKMSDDEIQQLLRETAKKGADLKSIKTALAPVFEEI